MKDKDKDKNKKSSGPKNYIYKKGKMTEQTSEMPPAMTNMLRALAAKKPFLKLVETFMRGIAESLEENQNVLPPEDTLKLPVGAMVYIVAHYYIYLNKVAKVESHKKFFKDFVNQTEAAIDLFNSAEKEPGKEG